MYEQLTAFVFRVPSGVRAAAVLGCVACGLMVSALAAVPEDFKVSVVGADVEHTNRQLRGLIEAGVAQGLARQPAGLRVRGAVWVFDVRGHVSIRPGARITARLIVAGHPEVQCSVVFADLDSAPSAVLVDEIARLSGSMLAGGEGRCSKSA
jgi:hypothetical protein